MGTELAASALRLPRRVFRCQATVLYTEAARPSNENWESPITLKPVAFLLSLV